MQDENFRKRTPHRMRLSAEKKLPTVIVGLLSLREKAPTKTTLFTGVIMPSFLSNRKLSYERASKQQISKLNFCRSNYGENRERLKSAPRSR